MKRLTVSVACGVGLFVVLAAILGSGVTTAADAAAISVTTTTDAIASGDGCSLREAVRAANLGTTVNECTGAPGLDVITLMAGTYVLTETGAGEDGALTGDLDIIDTLSIIGPGSGSTIIDGNGNDRVWDIHSGATTVVISGVTIFNGSVGGDGGGIRTAAGRLFVVNSVVDGNSASDSGGGLYVREGDVTLSGSQVIDNEAVGTLFDQGGEG